MVTRKVARSKRDAIAIAEAQLRESEPESDPGRAAKAQSRRKAQAASAARAREGKARLEAAKTMAKKTAAEARQVDAGRGSQRSADASGGGAHASVASATAAEQPTTKDTAATGGTTAPPRLSISTRNAGLSISTRNGGSRRVTPTSAAASSKNGVPQTDLLREELERKLQLLDPAITSRFGHLVWARRAAFPYWPALILDPRLLPEHQLPSALKELDEKCWVQLYGSRDIRQILFSALAAWDDTSHPYREGFPRSDFHRLTKLKDTFVVALNEASDQEKLSAEERLNIFKTEVVPSLGLPLPAPLPANRRRRKIAKVSKPDTPVSQANGKSVSVDDISSTLPSVGVQSKGSSETEKRKRLSTFVAQEMRGGEPESRYRLGQLTAYTARLRAVIRKASPDRVWRVQLLLSQLLDEKAFLREDLEAAGVSDVLKLVRDSENERWRELVETVRVHLNNCTLEEWPTARKSTAPDTRTQKRPASAPLLPDESDEHSDPKRARTSVSSSVQAQRNDDVAGGERLTVEAMAEAVARSMISRASIHTSSALFAANRSLSAGAAAATPVASVVDSPFISSSSAMASVGISPGLSVPSGSSAVSPYAVFSPGLANAQTISTTGTSTAQLSVQDASSNVSSQAISRHPTIAPVATASSRKKTTSARAFGPTVPVLNTQVSVPAPGIARSNPSLVIFNKDGTLLDFQTTWSSWIESQAWRLETGLGKPIREAFFDALGYNAHSRTMVKGGVFSTSLKHELGPKFAVQFLQKHGLEPVEAVRFVSQHWSLPKEVATFRARRDLPSLFRTIRELGVKIAIVTTDRRDITAKTLTHLGVCHLVDAVSCGDDGITNTPDRVWAICSRLGVSTSNTVMVGDTADDMVLARAAGCALAVGVLGGAAELSDLSAEADFLVPCVTNVIKLLYQYRHQATLG